MSLNFTKIKKNWNSVIEDVCHINFINWYVGYKSKLVNFDRRFVRFWIAHTHSHDDRQIEDYEINIFFESDNFCWKISR